jgi:hypothetical protein
MSQRSRERRWRGPGVATAGSAAIGTAAAGAAGAAPKIIEASEGVSPLGSTRSADDGGAPNSTGGIRR